MTETGIDTKPWLGGFGIGGDPASWSPKTWELIIKEKNITSIIDVGCGEGHHSKWFLEKGLDVLSIDGSELAFNNASEEVKKNFVIWDYTQGPYISSKKYKLGWAVEFVEHIEEKYISNFISTFKKCKYIAMTHALPGQGGYHHVNEQDRHYWIKKMYEYGFDLDDGYTQHIKDTGDGEYVKRTFLFFNNLEF